MHTFMKLEEFQIYSPFDLLVLIHFFSHFLIKGPAIKYPPFLDGNHHPWSFCVTENPLTGCPLKRIKMKIWMHNEMRGSKAKGRRKEENRFVRVGAWVSVEVRSRYSEGWKIHWIFIIPCIIRARRIREGNHQHRANFPATYAYECVYICIRIYLTSLIRVKT